MEVAGPIGEPIAKELSAPREISIPSARENRRRDGLQPLSVPSTGFAGVNSYAAPGRVRGNGGNMGGNVAAANWSLRGRTTGALSALDPAARADLLAIARGLAASKRRTRTALDSRFPTRRPLSDK